MQLREFGGRRHVLETAGLSYSQYARSGFWQLVAVTLLSLALIASLAAGIRDMKPIDQVNAVWPAQPDR